MDQSDNYIVIDRSIDVDAWQRSVDNDEGPRHYALEFAELTGAHLVGPHGLTIKKIDRLLSAAHGRPEDWALARAVRRHANAYVTDEMVGMPTMLLKLLSRQSLRNVAIFVNLVDRRRIRAWLRLCRYIKRKPVFVTDTPEKAALIARLTHATAERLEIVSYSVDENFFCPPSQQPAPNSRPLIASAGRAKRDYQTLAEAVTGLDVDVVICATSPDVAPTPGRAVTELPANMRFEDLSISELRNLYQRADLVVLATLPNHVRYGLSVALEAMSSGCPLVMTATDGLAAFAHAGAAVGVPPTDPTALRAAIVEILADHERLRELAAAGRAYVLERHSTDAYIRELAQIFAKHGWPLHVAPDRAPVDHLTVSC